MAIPVRVHEVFLWLLKLASARRDVSDRHQIETEDLKRAMAIVAQTPTSVDTPATPELIWARETIAKWNGLIAEAKERLNEASRNIFGFFEENRAGSTYAEKNLSLTTITHTRIRCSLSVATTRQVTRAAQSRNANEAQWNRAYNHGHASWELYEEIRDTLNGLFGLNIQDYPKEQAFIRCVRPTLQVVRELIPTNRERSRDLRISVPSMKGSETSALIALFSNYRDCLGRWLPHCVETLGDLDDVVGDTEFDLLTSNILSRALRLAKNEVTISEELKNLLDRSNLERTQWLAKLWNEWQEPALIALDSIGIADC